MLVLVLVHRRLLTFAKAVFVFIKVLSRGEEGTLAAQIDRGWAHLVDDGTAGTDSIAA